jgi:hypothetical protein
MAALRAEAMLLAARSTSEVAVFLDESERAVREQGERFVLPYLALARARLAFACGDRDQAMQQLAQARESSKEMGIAPVAALADDLAETTNGPR